MKSNQIEYYELTMTTSNPSANRSGYFFTEQEAYECQKEWEKIVEDDKAKEDDNYEGYYGETNFNITKITIYLGKENFG